MLLIIPHSAIKGGNQRITNRFAVQHIYWVSTLVAEIRPVATAFPVSSAELLNLGNSDFALYETLQTLTNANSLAIINLRNEGDVLLKDVRVVVPKAILFAEPAGRGSETRIIAHDEQGITIDKMIQGTSRTIYVWMSSSYFSWYSIDNDFSISYENGLATKHFYLEASSIASWFDRHPIMVMFVVVFVVIPAILIATITLFAPKSKPVSAGTENTKIDEGTGTIQ